MHIISTPNSQDIWSLCEAELLVEMNTVPRFNLNCFIYTRQRLCFTHIWHFASWIFDTAATVYAVLSEAMVTMVTILNVFENTAFLFLRSTQITFRKYGNLYKYTKSNLCISNVNLLSLSLCIPGPIWCCWLLSLGLGCCDGSGQQEISARAVHSIGHHLPQLSHGPWTLAVLLPASASFC